MKTNVIFDLDGTLANCEHRRKYLKETPKNWKAFNNTVDQDTVIEHVAELFRFYKKQGYNVILLSGRMCTPDTEEKTYTWLRNNNLFPTWQQGYFQKPLHMRKEGDFRPDVEVKREMIDQLGLTPENTVAVFDDRNCMVNAWRLWGFNCFQVAEGDF